MGRRKLYFMLEISKYTLKYVSNYCYTISLCGSVMVQSGQLAYFYLGAMHNCQRLTECECKKPIILWEEGGGESMVNLYTFNPFFFFIIFMSNYKFEKCL